MTNTDQPVAYGKPWYTSRTIWGGIIGIGSSAAAMLFGYQASGADINQIIDSMTKVGEGVAVVVSGVGSVIAIIGRIRAAMPIVKK